MGKLRQSICPIVLVCFGSACATAGSPTSRVATEVSSSAPIVLRSDGSFRLVSSSWEGETFRAQVVRKELCQPAERHEILHQKVVERETRNVGWGLFGGIVWTGLGAGLIAARDSFSDEAEIDPQTGKEKMSPREGATFWGVASLLVGIPMTIQALVIADRGREDVGEPWTTVEVVPTGPEKACGERPVTRGQLWVSSAGDTTSLGRVTFRDSIALRLDEQTVPGLCSREDLLGQPVRVWLEVEGAPPEVLGIGSADPCIRRTAATAALARAERGLKDANGISSLAEAARQLERAAELTGPMAVEDPARGPLLARIEAARAIADRAASSLLDRALRNYQDALRAGDRDAAGRAGGDALILAHRVPDRWTETARSVGASLGERAGVFGLRVDPLVRSIVSRSPELSACVYGEAGCADTEATRSFRDALGTVAAAVVTEVATVTKAIAKSRATLERKASEKQHEALVAELDRAAEPRALCRQRPWDPGLASSCAALEAEWTRSDEVLVARREELRKARERKELAAWRRDIATCRKLATTAAALREIDYCDASCQRVIAAAVRDLNRLRDRDWSSDDVDDTNRAAVRAECRDAGCPSCP